MRQTLWWLVVGMTACSPEYSLHVKHQVDAFKQQPLAAWDVLFVVDDSCSMAEEQAHIAANFDHLIDAFTEMDVDWQVGVTTTEVGFDDKRGLLQGGSDELVLLAPDDTVIDHVGYDRTWPFARGVAMQLDVAQVDATANDSLDAWCVATTDYGGGLGTPGLPNEPCDAGTGVDLDAPDTGPRPPATGELVFSEIMAMSSTTDSLCEWAELTNVTTDTLDISGYTLRDDGGNHATLGTASVAPGQAMVFGRSEEPGCGLPVDLVVPTGFTLADSDLRFVDEDTPQMAEALDELLAVGTDGYGIEMGLEAATLVFSEPYASVHNAGFLREEAGLFVLFMSDEDDRSPESVDTYVNLLRDVKGDAAHRYENVARFAAVVGIDPPSAPGEPSCSSEDGEAVYGARYVDFVQSTDGLLRSICDDFDSMVLDAGLYVTGLDLEFRLTTLPYLESLSVSLLQNVNDSSFVRELYPDQDFTLDIREDDRGDQYVVLVFTEETTPPAEWFVVAEYDVLPSGATLVGP